MATIGEVAEHAGVSIKTVSRVMNNYEHISIKTRDKVQASMQALNYVPSPIARQMRMGDQMSIGMVCGDLSSGYLARLNHAMLKACSDARRYLAVELFDEKSTEWRKQVEAFLDRARVKNIVLVPPMCDSSDLHELLKERDVRFALISPSRPVSGAISIAMDDRMAAMEMTQHLIDLGHKRIGHIGGDMGHVATLLRQQGYEEALLRAGLGRPEASLMEPGHFRFKDALDCADRMLTCKNRPTAIFAANDEMAAAVVMTANRLGLSVPGDLSIAGFDNTEIAQTIWPELTTVSQPYEDIAKEAVRLSVQNTSANNGISATHVLPHKLLIRDSTAPAPQI